jgi:hypothetical protein
MPIIIDQFEFDALDDDLKALLGASDQLGEGNYSERNRSNNRIG